MQPISLDVHAHLIPIEADSIRGLADVTWDRARESLTIDGREVGMKSLLRPQALIDWMDANRIARAWVSAPPPAYRMHLSAQDAMAWCSYLHEGLHAVCARYPDRLEPLLHLPVEHPTLALELAARELRRGYTRFAMAAGDGRTAVLSDSAYEPLWSALDGAGAFLLLHPPESSDARLHPFYLGNLLGNPYETALAFCHLAMGGVLGRYPGIRICLAHGGGASAMVVGRLQRGYDTKRPSVDLRLSAPQIVAGRVLVDCIMHDPRALRLACQVFGEDNVVFGSDWPFPMGLPDPHAQLAGLAPDLRQRVLDRNARQLRG